MPLPEDTISTVMKNLILCLGVELGILVTTRRVPTGLLFWHSTDEHIH
jgi:hypothetical protein